VLRQLVLREDKFFHDKAPLVDGTLCVCRWRLRGKESGTAQPFEAATLKPKRYYLVRITDAGSVPCSTTNHKGSEFLRALFLGWNSRVEWGLVR
jgi:hypothetical protein